MITEEHVLACIDGSAVTGSVCDYAVWYAKKLNLAVGLLHVSDVAASVRRDLSGAIGINSRQSLLDELSKLDEQRAKVVNSYSNALVQDAKSHIQSNFAGVTVCIYQRRGKLLPAIEHFQEKTVLSSWAAAGKTIKTAASISVAKSKRLPVPQTYRC